MTEMFGEAWSPMSVPDLAPDDDDDKTTLKTNALYDWWLKHDKTSLCENALYD